MEDTKIVLLNVEDLQKIFNCGRNKALALMSIKTFPSIKIGRTYFVEEQELYIWLKKNKYNRVDLL